MQAYRQAGSLSIAGEHARVPELCKIKAVDRIMHRLPGCEEKCKELHSRNRVQLCVRAGTPVILQVVLTSGCGVPVRCSSNKTP